MNLPFIVHGTMADPRWLDPTIDPNDRTPGTCYLGDPRVVNMGPVGLARFCTLRAWLSQWSYGDALDAGPDIAIPALLIGNLADDACTPSHTRRLFDAIGHPDKEMYEIPGANHYYAGPDHGAALRNAVGICTDWLHRHQFQAFRDDHVVAAISKEEVTLLIDVADIADGHPPAGVFQASLRYSKG